MTGELKAATIILIIIIVLMETCEVLFVEQKKKRKKKKGGGRGVHGAHRAERRKQSLKKSRARLRIFPDYTIDQRDLT